MNKQTHRRLFQMAAAIPAGIETKDADLEIQIKTIRDEIIKSVDGNVEKMQKMQNQLDALDIKLAQRHVVDPNHHGSLKSILEENESVARLIHDRKGRCVINIEGKASDDLFSRKSTITTGAVGVSTTGVLQIERMPGITTEARQVLKVRDMLAATPTTFQVIDYVKVNSPLVKASPQVEASTKFENAVTFTSASERVKTIATFIPASRQILEDMTELLSFLETGLKYYVDLAEELQLLSGSGTGEDLNGLLVQASAFNPGLLSASAGWNKIDIIGRAIQQVEEAKEVMPTFIVLHPNDWWSMRLTKDGFGRYILGDPQANVTPSLFDRPVVSTTSIAAGTFMVGSGDPAAAEIRDRMQTTIDISTEDSDNFRKNLVTVRAEKRVALIVRRPASFITGSLTSSPA